MSAPRFFAPQRRFCDKSCERHEISRRDTEVGPRYLIELRDRAAQSIRIPKNAYAFPHYSLYAFAHGGRQAGPDSRIAGPWVAGAQFGVTSVESGTIQGRRFARSRTKH